MGLLQNKIGKSNWIIGILPTLLVVMAGCTMNEQWTISTVDNFSGFNQNVPSKVNFFKEEDEFQIDPEESFDVILENNNEQTFETDEYYDLYYYEDGEWRSVELHGLTLDVIRFIEPNETKEFEIYLKPPLNGEELEDEGNHDYEEGFYKIEKNFSWENSDSTETIDLYFEVGFD